MKGYHYKVIVLNVLFTLSVLLWGIFSVDYLIRSTLLFNKEDIAFKVFTVVFFILFSGGGLALLVYSFNPYRKDYTQLYRYIKTGSLSNALEIIKKGNLSFARALMIADVAKEASNTEVEIASLVCAVKRKSEDYSWVDGSSRSAEYKNKHKKDLDGYKVRLAELYLYVKDYTKALSLYETVPLTIQERITVYSQCACYSKLLEFCERIQEHLNRYIIQEHVKGAGEEALKEWEEERALVDVTILGIYSKIEDFAQSGESELVCRIYRGQNKYELSAQEYRKIGNYRAASYDYALCGNYKMAAEMCELDKRYKDAGDFYYKLGLYDKASACFSRASLKNTDL